MIWVGWRLQRTETVIAAGILVLLAALLVPTGLHMASVYHHDGLASCASLGTHDCNFAIDDFTRRFENLGGLLGWFNLVPGLIGVLLATPLILELENGTYRLAWTQSVTRRRWLVSRFGLVCGAAVLAGLALTVLMTWWRTPLDHLHGRMGTNVFDFEGTVVVAYVLFAVGLALAVGVVWRRTVPALVAGFVGYTAARIFVQASLRKRYETPLSSTWSRGSSPDLSRAWVLSEGPSNRLGHPLPNTFDVLQLCSRAVNGSVRAIDPSCLAKHGAGYNHAVYQPASRFWLFQGIETALFGGVALALILFAAWWIHERTS